MTDTVTDAASSSSNSGAAEWGICIVASTGCGGTREVAVTEAASSSSGVEMDVVS
jgi:hypothetical protein